MFPYIHFFVDILVCQHSRTHCIWTFTHTVIFFKLDNLCSNLWYKDWNFIRFSPLLSTVSISQYAYKNFSVCELLLLLWRCYTERIIRRKKYFCILLNAANRKIDLILKFKSYMTSKLICLPGMYIISFVLPPF